ncbi:unnamed protein product [Gongylonema pulchrum]|uniref:7TM_GPCR_Srx domain-containing protein n=2 Tax=Gongylonema pulchrum TaxID=637853 RepID=A0A183ECQ5_9BILA|nr:unnamed protein product [Gongylonema pulchrum]
MILIIPLLYAYIFLGLVSVIIHCFFGYALARNQTLLQRYRVIIAEIVANGVSAAALMIAGIGRLGMFYSNYNKLVSRRQCMLMPWNILLAWTSDSQIPFFADMFLIIVIVTSIGSVVLYIAVYAMTRKNVRSARKIQMV